VLDLGLLLEIHHLDFSPECIRLSVDTFNFFGSQELFVIELSNLVFLIDLHCSVSIPLEASDFLEKSHLDLTFLGQGELLSLGEVEWQSEELLLIRSVDLDFKGEVTELLESLN
jgi:hypothetical protein